MLVRSSISGLIAAWIAASEIESRALVASSKISSAGSFSSARAMEIRCFSPPESFSPRLPTMVSSPSGCFEMKSQMFAFWQASIISASVASGLA